MSHVWTNAEYDARQPYTSQVHTWGDASILALLLAADFSWLVEDTAVNKITLPLVLAWSLFITYAAFVERRANPDECIVASTTALWCFGNGFWNLTDLAWWEWEARRRRSEANPDGDPYDAGDPSTVTYGGIRLEHVQSLDTVVGVCFAVAFAVGVAYFAHFRYTDAFVSARRARGDGVADDYSETPDGDDEEDTKPETTARDDERGILEIEDVLARGDSGGDFFRTVSRAKKQPSRRMVHSGFPFLGPAFMPNVFRVQSRAEYEALSHFLWIFNDLCLYFAVEFEDVWPANAVLFAKVCMATVATWLIAHSVDALAVALRESAFGGATPGVRESLAIRRDHFEFPDPEPPDEPCPCSTANVFDSEVVTKFSALFWVVAMTVWSFGDAFFPDPESRIGAEVNLFSLDAGPGIEGPESSRWWAAWCMMLGVFVLALFWGSELAAIARRSVCRRGAPP